MAKVYIVLRGGHANIYKYLQGGGGVQKVQNLVYVEYGCPQVQKHLCTTCGKSFVELSILRDHMYTHSDEPQFACDKCENKKFWNKTQLYRHKVSVHEDRKKDYICTYCGKVFDCSGRLKRHSSIVSTKQFFMT